MITNTQKLQQILRRIYRIPSNKLKELDDFISKLEQTISKKTNTLSFAGAWKDLDDSVFNELTENLIKNRERNKRITGE